MKGYYSTLYMFVSASERVQGIVLMCAHAGWWHAGLSQKKHAVVHDVTSQTATIYCSKDSKHIAQKHQRQNDETQ